MIHSFSESLTINWINMKIKNLKHLLVIGTALLLGSLFTYGATPPKILTVDMEQIYSNYNKAKDSQEQWVEAVKSAREEVSKMIQDGLKMGEEFQELQAKSNNAALTEEARKKYTEEAQAKAEEIQKKEAEINQFRQQTDQSLAQRRESIINLHMSEIKDVVAKVAREKAADLVFNSSGLMVLYADKAMDVTPESLKMLNGTEKPKETMKEGAMATKKKPEGAKENAAVPTKR